MTIPLLSEAQLASTLFDELSRIAAVKLKLEKQIFGVEARHSTRRLENFGTVQLKYEQLIKRITDQEVHFLKSGSLRTITPLMHNNFTKSRIRWLLLRIIISKYYLENLKSAADGEMVLEAQIYPKRRKNLPEKSKEVLKSWFKSHIANPYPTPAEKEELASQTELSYDQVNTWFINERVRNWQRVE